MKNSIGKIILSNEDLKTASIIIAEKAMQMHKRGTMWQRSGKDLSCVDIGKIANVLLELTLTGEQYDFDSAFAPKKKKTRKPIKQ